MYPVSTGIAGVNDVQRLGEKVRTLRKRRGMTLKELALGLGFTSHSYVSEIETGKKKPTTEMIIKLADLFGVSVDFLVRDELDLE
jgi:transcriptional regulator with XRE-family HTH domain